MTAADHTAAVN